MIISSNLDSYLDKPVNQYWEIDGMAIPLILKLNHMCISFYRNINIKWFGSRPVMIEILSIVLVSAPKNKSQDLLFDLV